MRRLLFIFVAVLISIQFVGNLACVRPEKPEIPPVPTSEEDISYSLKNLSATDALGRRFSVVSAKKEETKLVGLFYLLWHGQHHDIQHGIYNIQELMDTDVASLNNPKGTPASPLGEMHFWGEPLYGYYDMRDPWVVTRHVELFVNAGIDYLFLDTTNGLPWIYPESAENLFNVLLSYQRQGFDIPKIVFWTHHDCANTVDAIYEQYYKSGKYESLWFKPKGKPMLVGVTENNGGAALLDLWGRADYIKSPMQEYFDVREAQWPNGNYNSTAFPYMSWVYPPLNHNGGVAIPGAQLHPVEINVSSMLPQCSRGYNNITKQVEEDWTAGANFQTMWDAVFDREEMFNDVHITGFNEWIATKYADDNGKVFFVDVYNHEFSRDLEMMKGGSNDNFYLQMIRNIRKFKFTEGSNVSQPHVTIDIRTATETTWQQVEEAYRDYAGDAMPRNFTNAVGSDMYIDTSNRNDITEIKVAHDTEYVYFMVKTLENITRYNGTDVNWMNILISTNGGNSFEGYHYIVNRQPGTDGKTTIEKSTGGYNWTDNGSAEYSVNDKLMQFAIPLSALELLPDNCKFQFKVADHVTKYDDIMDYYVSGDSAPIGRLNFSYGY